MVEDNAVCKSLGRALTYSFGRLLLFPLFLRFQQCFVFMSSVFGFSICFGALVEAVIRAVLAMLREAERQNNSNACLVVALCILRCIVNLIQNLVEYVKCSVHLRGSKDAMKLVFVCVAVNSSIATHLSMWHYMV